MKKIIVFAIALFVITNSNLFSQIKTSHPKMRGFEYERIPCQNYEMFYNDVLGERTQRNIGIQYKGMVPVLGLVPNTCNPNEGFTWVDYLDTSTVVLPDSLFRYHPFPSSNVTPWYYNVSLKKNVHILIMDMATGGIVIHEYITPDMMNLDPNGNGLIDDGRKVGYDIDINYLSKETSYFVFWFTEEFELFFVDKIRFQCYY